MCWILHHGATLETEVLVCESCESDTKGSMDFSHPRHAGPNIALTDYSCPTLMLLARVHELRFIPFRCRVDPNPQPQYKSKQHRTRANFSVSSFVGFKPIYISPCLSDGQYFLLLYVHCKLLYNQYMFVFLLFSVFFISEN